MKQVILLSCYEKQKILTLQQGVLKAQAWAIVEAISQWLNPMTTMCDE